MAQWIAYAAHDGRTLVFRSPRHTGRRQHTAYRRLLKAAGSSIALSQAIGTGRSQKEAVTAARAALPIRRAGRWFFIRHPDLQGLGIQWRRPSFAASHVDAEEHDDPAPPLPRDQYDRDARVRRSAWAIRDIAAEAVRDERKRRERRKRWASNALDPALAFQTVGDRWKPGWFSHWPTHTKAVPCFFAFCTANALYWQRCPNGFLRAYCPDHKPGPSYRLQDRA